MAGRTPHGRRLDQILADGHWHPLGQVLEEVAAAVTPGVAYRAGENHRRWKGGPQVRAQGDETTAVAAGARMTARQTVWGRVRRGTVQRDGRMIRRAPR